MYLWTCPSRSYRKKVCATHFLSASSQSKQGMMYKSLSVCWKWMRWCNGLQTMKEPNWERPLVRQWIGHCTRLGLKAQALPRWKPMFYTYHKSWCALSIYLCFFFFVGFQCAALPGCYGEHGPFRTALGLFLGLLPSRPAALVRTCWPILS